MVSVYEIKKNFNDFIKQISKRKGKKLDSKDKQTIFTEFRIFEELFEEKGFLLQAGKLAKFYSSVINNKNIINETDLRVLKGILAELQ